MNEKIKNICIKFINEYFPNNISWFITGSYANNENRENSDIDLVVIDNFREIETRNSYQFENYIFDVGILPQHNLILTLINDYSKSYGMYITQISSGYSVCKNEFTFKLKSYCSKIFELGSVNLNKDSYKLDAIENEINKKLESLKLTKDLNQKLILASEVNNNLFIYLSNYFSIWPGPLTFQYKQLKKILPDFFKNYLSMYRELLNSGSPNIFSDYISDFIIKENNNYKSSINYKLTYILIEKNYNKSTTFLLNEILNLKNLISSKVKVIDSIVFYSEKNANFKYVVSIELHEIPDDTFKKHLNDCALHLYSASGIKTHIRWGLKIDNSLFGAEFENIRHSFLRLFNEFLFDLLNTYKSELNKNSYFFFAINFFLLISKSCMFSKEDLINFVRVNEYLFNELSNITEYLFYGGNFQEFINNNKESLSEYDKIFSNWNISDPFINQTSDAELIIDAIRSEFRNETIVYPTFLLKEIFPEINQDILNLSSITFLFDECFSIIGLNPLEKFLIPHLISKLIYKAR